MDNAKLFVGGISRETSEDALRTHFSKYGTVLGSLVAKEKGTRNPRGFGFVWFSDASFADKALGDSHVILGRTVDVKKAVPKSEQLQVHQHQQQLANQQKNNGFGENTSNGNGNDYFRTKKIFVGGLSSSLTEEQFKNYFERFGKIVDVVVMQDSSTNRPRGFGFVTFDSEESVDKVMQLNTFHDLNGRMVEVKRAVPKEGLNGTNNSYISKGGIRGPSTEIFQHGYYLPCIPGYEILPGYVPFPGYNGVGWYSYGTGIYGGYPMQGYGRPGVGATAVAPRSSWSSPVMVGPALCPPYNNPFIYPNMNGGDNIMSMMLSGQTGIIGPCENGKVNETSGGNGRQPSDSTMPPLEGIKSGVDSSRLSSNNDGASS